MTTKKKRRLAELREYSALLWDEKHRAVGGSMMNRRLVYVGNFLGIVHGDGEQQLEMREVLGSLADALNSKLPEYEVGLLHLGGDKFLAFRRKPEEKHTHSEHALEPFTAHNYIAEDSEGAACSHWTVRFRDSPPAYDEVSLGAVQTITMVSWLNKCWAEWQDGGKQEEKQ